MVKKCPFCGELNQNSFNYCSNCGNPLFNKDNIFASSKENKNLIFIGYLFTFIFCWGGVFLSLFSSIGVFGLFLPFYLTSSDDSTMRKHGYIQMVLSVLGLVLTFSFRFKFF